jgi:hypothetical protein
MVIFPTLDVGFVGCVARMAHQFIPLTRSQGTENPEESLLIQLSAVVEAKKAECAVKWLPGSGHPAKQPAPSEYSGTGYTFATMETR